MTSRRVLFVSLLLMVFGFTIGAHAQFSSNVQGVASDKTGAVIPGAKVVLTNTDTGVVQTTTSGPRGEYRFVSLAPGPYAITASATGFATHKVVVTLTTGQTMDVPFSLEVSTQAQSRRGNGSAAGAGYGGEPDAADDRH